MEVRVLMIGVVYSVAFEGGGDPAIRTARHGRNRPRNQQLGAVADGAGESGRVKP